MIPQYTQVHLELIEIIKTNDETGYFIDEMYQQRKKECFVVCNASYIALLKELSSKCLCVCCLSLRENMCGSYYRCHVYSSNVKAGHIFSPF